MSNVPVHGIVADQSAVEILDSCQDKLDGDTQIKIDCTKFDLSKYSALRVSGYLYIGTAANVSFQITAGKNDKRLKGWKIKDGTMSSVDTSERLYLSTDNSWSAGASFDLFISSSRQGTSDSYPMLVKLSAVVNSGNYRSLYEFTLYHNGSFETLSEIFFGYYGTQVGYTIYGYRK